MAQEMHGKFLVKGRYKSVAIGKLMIKQASLSSFAGRTVRKKSKKTHF